MSIFLCEKAKIVIIANIGTPSSLILLQIDTYCQLKYAHIMNIYILIEYMRLKENFNYFAKSDICDLGFPPFNILLRRHRNSPLNF